MAHRAIAVWALLSVIPAAGAGAEGLEGRADIVPLSPERPDLSPAPARGGLTLVLFDPTSSLPIPAEQLRIEVEGVFRELGVEVSWREGRDAPVTAGADLQVIVLPSDRSGGRLSANTMGAVRRGEDAPRALWVFLPAVHAALGQPARSDTPLSAADRAFLARALARVIGHETIHALAPELPHSGKGLMASKLDRRELLRDGIRIDGAARAALAAGLRSWVDVRPTARGDSRDVAALARR